MLFFPFFIIHFDVWMSTVDYISSYRYYVLFIEDYSRYSWIYPMKNKSEVFLHYQTSVAMTKNLFNASIKYLQSDGGIEYVNHYISDFFQLIGIQQRLSCPYTPQQNGLAKCKHHLIADMTRTLLTPTKASLMLWVEAVLTSVHLINLLPTLTLSWSTPHTLLFGRSPSYTHLHTFGCLCFPYLGNYVKNKLTPRFIECAFVGYSSSHKGYRCLDPTLGCVDISHHVVFNEAKFLFHKLIGHVPSSYVELSIYVIAPSTTSTAQTSSPDLLAQGPQHLSQVTPTPRLIPSPLAADLIALCPTFALS